MDSPPPKRLCLGLHIPRPVEDGEEDADARRNNGRAVDPVRMEPRVDNYAVHPAKPHDQAGMRKNFYDMVCEAWDKSPRVQTGVCTDELKRCGINRVDKLLVTTAASLGCPHKDSLFPRIRRKLCRPDLAAGLKRKARLVPAWLLIFVLDNVRNHQFSKINDPYRIMTLVLNQVRDGLLDASLGLPAHLPALIQESLLIKSRRNAILLQYYGDDNQAQVAFIPLLQAQVRALQAQVRALQTQTRTQDDRVKDLEADVESLLAAQE